MICIKCGKDLVDTQFFKMEDGTRYNVCKKCLTMYIDNRKPETFKWILEKFDIPYVERIWIQQTNKAYLKNPSEFGPQSVLGKYMRTMHMHQWKPYHYSDSDMLNNETKRQRDAAKAARKELNADMEKADRELAEKFKNGEISEAEFQTMRSGEVSDEELGINTEDMSIAVDCGQEEEDSVSLLDEIPGSDTQKDEANKVLDIPDMPDDKPGIDEAFIPDMTQINEDQIKDELTPDDIKYLSLKWGMLYKPSEWVELERLYQKYAADYELSTDREQSLKAICKTDLKMNQAIDVGDVKTFKDLQAANDQLRKSAKFTDAQKQEQKKRELDSIGELVAFVEQKGGIIPMFDDPIEVPQDKIDFIIKDLKKYTSNLVKNELGLGNLIESFIQKTKEQKTESAEDIMRQGIKTDEENVVTQQEAEDFQQFLLDEREEEAKRLAEEYVAE